MQHAFKACFGDVAVRPADVNDLRGLEKREAIRLLLERCMADGRCTPSGDLKTVIDKLYTAFREQLGHHICDMRTEFAGVSRVFEELHQANIAVVVGRVQLSRRCSLGAVCLKDLFFQHTLLRAPIRNWISSRHSRWHRPQRRLANLGAGH